MKNIVLIKYLDELLNLQGFKKKGTQWLLEENNIIKIIKLTKSRHGNNYYIDYGYIIKKLELDGLNMHIFNRMSSMNIEENEKIKEILNFDIAINDIERLQQIHNNIDIHILSKFKNIKGTDDILKELKERNQLNDIPLIVKEYFKL